MAPVMQPGSRVYADRKTATIQTPTGRLRHGRILKAWLASHALGELAGVEAQALLAHVYHWFTEGVETEDLKETRDLLQALK